MPQIRKQRMPKQLMRHLLLRMIERKIATDQLVLFSDWIDTDPEVPAGRWYKKFPGLIVCGEGELVKTFLRPGRLPEGQEVI